MDGKSLEAHVTWEEFDFLNSGDGTGLGAEWRKNVGKRLRGEAIFSREEQALVRPGAHAHVMLVPHKMLGPEFARTRLRWVDPLPIDSGGHSGLTGLVEPAKEDPEAHGV